jgi:GTP:adenosylcobinamide-phosphate guanylyltransferase
MFSDKRETSKLEKRIIMTDTTKLDPSTDFTQPMPDTDEIVDDCCSTAAESIQTGAIHVVVLAGERACSDSLSLSEGVVNKSMIDIFGHPILSWVLRALAGSRASLPAHVIGLEGTVLEHAADGVACHSVKSLGKGPTTSLLKSIENGSISFPFLATTSDHALLTPDIIDTFLEKSIASDADVCVGIAERTTIEAAYPQVRRTYHSIGGVELSGCDLYYLARPEAIPVVQFWQQTEKDRKKPWRIALRFGPLTMLRILFKRSGPEAVFAMLSRHLGVRVKPVILPFAEAAIDVDKTDDLALVREIIAHRAQ